MEPICNLLFFYVLKDTFLYYKNIFLLLVVVFFILICKTPVHIYYSLKDIFYNMAMMQICIQLHFFGYLMGNL